VGLLLEWTSLVCALENRPLADFTTILTTPLPIFTIINFYFPRTHSVFIQANRKYIPWIVARGTYPSRPIDARVAIGRLALLAAQVIRSNDRVQVRVLLTLTHVGQAARAIQRAYRRGGNKRQYLPTISSTTSMPTPEVEILLVAIQSFARGYLLRRRIRRGGLKNASRLRKR